MRAAVAGAGARIDLHTHSSCSDGTDTPRELVRAAVRAGIDVLGLTDHDTAAGWVDALDEARRLDVGLLPGMEISTHHRGRGVHLLAYLPDPTHPGLRALLDQVLQGRAARVPGMVRRLRELGIEISEDDVRAAAGPTEATGRPHVADALVALGVVRDRTAAFDRYLGAGRPVYRDRAAVALVDVLQQVRAAGGVGVIAHPWGRHDPGVLDRAGLAELREQGLAGIEVDHQDHAAPARRELRAIAAELDLVVTGSSDHHGLGKVDHPLGCNLTDPAELARLLERAAQAAAEAPEADPPRAHLPTGWAGR